MAEFPKSKAERDKIRDQIWADLLDQTEREFLNKNRSIKCGAPEGMFKGWRHASDPDGCKNDGSSCLCTCHDEMREEL